MFKERLSAERSARSCVTPEDFGFAGIGCEESSPIAALLKLQRFFVEGIVGGLPD